MRPADTPAAAPADHTVRDRVVAILFAIAIAWPGLALVSTWDRALTRFENRPTAAWPRPALTREFPAAFDRAFSDRFGGRDTLVRLHHLGLLQAFNASSLETILIGRDGWFYWIGEDAHALDRHFRGLLEFPQQHVDGTVKEFVRRSEWLASKGIAYVVVVVPDKFTIYPEYLPWWISRSEKPSPYDRVRDALARDGRVAFVDLRPALLAAKARERVYFKTDSHWNFNGAIVAYQALMPVAQAKLGDKLAQVAPAKRPAYVPGVDHYSGDLLQMLGKPRIVEEDVAPLAKVLADTTRCARRAEIGDLPGHQIHVCDKPGLPRAVMLRDSMAIALIPLVSENFSRIVYVSSRALDRDLVEREKPDIVIEELVERTLHAPGAFPLK
jgi:hypothetical protein